MLYRVYSPLRWGIVFVSLLAFGFLIVGCAGSQQKGASPVAGSFVGETSDPNTLVAVIADKPGQAEDQREVKAYLCDGKAINEWLKSSVAGNELVHIQTRW